MRHTKQLLYGVLYLIFWIGIGSGIYFHYIKPAPSCFDTIQNQNEEGIDCGGVCGNECIPTLQSIKANTVWALPLTLVNPPKTSTSSAFLATSTPDSSRITLLAEVRNPNPDYGAAGFNYTFTLYDTAGNQITSFPGSSYIYGAEVKYLALPNLELPASSPTVQSATLTITQPSWKKTSLFAKPAVAVNLRGVDTNGTFTVQGEVSNKEAVPLHVDLIAIFYDTAGNPKGASIAALDRLPGGSTREFAIFHPLITNVASERTQVFASAYTTQ
jgi:hypothetical protein